MFLFNKALNIFYLWLYGIGHMVKNHSDSERNPAATTTWATIFDLQQVIFYMHHTIDRKAHAMAVAMSVVEYWLGRELAQ